MTQQKHKKKVWILISLLLVLAFLLTACLPGTPNTTGEKPAGFFLGIWHGWIAPISLIVGFFDPAVRIYEVRNTGWLYDFGFYIAIISGFGGLSLARSKARRNR